MTRSGPALTRTASETTSAEGAWCREATSKASETSAPPSRDRASSTASAVAFAGSGSVESAAPILITSTLTPVVFDPNTGGFAAGKADLPGEVAPSWFSSVAPLLVPAPSPVLSPEPARPRSQPDGSRGLAAPRRAGCLRRAARARRGARPCSRPYLRSRPPHGNEVVAHSAQRALMYRTPKCLLLVRPARCSLSRPVSPARPPHSARSDLAAKTKSLSVRPSIL